MAGDGVRARPIRRRFQWLRRAGAQMRETGGTQPLDGAALRDDRRLDDLPHGGHEDRVDVVGLGQARMWSAARSAKASSTGTTALKRSTKKPELIGASRPHG